MKQFLAVKKGKLSKLILQNEPPKWDFISKRRRIQICEVYCFLDYRCRVSVGRGLAELISERRENEGVDRLMRLELNREIGDANALINLTIWCLSPKRFDRLAMCQVAGELKCIKEDGI